MKKTFLFTILCLTASLVSFSQNVIKPQKITSDGFFYTENKFYVVVVVLSIIMLGLLLYVMNLDKKVSKMEKEQKNKSI
jgi:magnesium-transporting ATPase (P-type)